MSQQDVPGTTQPGGWSSVAWSTAATATLHCLTGCALGEVVGMIVGTALGWSDLGTVVISVVLAFVYGYSLTIAGRGVRRHHAREPLDDLAWPRPRGGARLPLSVREDARAAERGS